MSGTVKIAEMGAQSLIWTLIAVTGALDVAMFAAQGMNAVISWRAVIYLAVLCALPKIVQRRCPPAGRLAGAFAQIFTFCEVGNRLTYAAMAASPFPLADGLLNRADAAIGFDWLAWFMWVKAHPALHFVLANAYGSIPLQVLVLFVYFAFRGGKRVDELVLATIFAIAIVIPVMVFFPAVGAWTEHGVGMVEPWRGDILALRSHTLLTVDRTQGIVSFPSFHTTAAVLLVNMTRGSKWFLPMLVLNVLVIASVMSEGAHYGVDMLSGLAVACAAIAASRTALVWCRRVKTSLAPSSVSGEAPAARAVYL